MSRTVCECADGHKPSILKGVADFLREFGDDLPEPTIRDATKPETLNNWQIICDCNNPKKIVSVGHWIQNDWYLCTVKHVATHKAYRGRGYGRSTVAKVTNHALKNGCLVLAADVTATNVPSQKIFERLGFEKVSTFCWEKGEKPANILHYVKTSAKDGNC